MLQKRHTKFSFVSLAYPQTKFSVVRFKGVEGLSLCYRFNIVLASDDFNVDLRAVLDSPATFSIRREEGDIPYHGYIIEFEELQRMGDMCFYRAKLAPRFWWLSLTRHNQVILDKSLTQAMQIVLEDGGLISRDYRLALREQYPVREYICQYEETHLNFVSRWMEWAGMYYYFEQGQDSEVLVITDSMVAHEAMPQGNEMVYAPPSGLEQPYLEEIVSQFYCTQRKMPHAVVVRDYNYQTPDLELMGKAEVSPTGLGHFYHYGDGVLSPSEARKQAVLRAQELQCKERVFEGNSTIPYLRPGYHFKLNEHFRPEFNCEYLTVEVKHEGSQAAYLRSGLSRSSKGADDQPSYKNTFTCIPADIQYRPERKHSMTRIHGYLPARIDAAGEGQYAQVDEQGRYKVIMPFDLSGRGQGKASAWIRKAQPYTGSGHGMHFPLHKGTEVALGFVGGNPDLPVIGAALPNPNAPSVISTRNQTMAGFCSGSGGGLNLEDAKGHERMVLHSGNKRSFLKIGSGSDDETWMASDNAVAMTNFCETCFTGEFSQAAGLWKNSQAVGGLKNMIISSIIKDIIKNAPSLATSLYEGITKPSKPDPNDPKYASDPDQYDRDEKAYNDSKQQYDDVSRALGCVTTAVQPVLDIIADIAADKILLEKVKEAAEKALEQKTNVTNFTKNYNMRYNITLTANGESNTIDNIATMTSTNYKMLNASIAAGSLQAGWDASADNQSKASDDKDNKVDSEMDSQGVSAGIGGATGGVALAAMLYKQRKWKKEYATDKVPETKRAGIGLLANAGPIVLNALDGDICLDTQSDLQMLSDNRMNIWSDDISLGSVSYSPLVLKSYSKLAGTSANICLQGWNGVEIRTAKPDLADYDKIGATPESYRFARKPKKEGISIIAQSDHNIYIQQDQASATAAVAGAPGSILLSSQNLISAMVDNSGLVVDDKSVTIGGDGDKGIVLYGSDSGSLKLDSKGCRISYQGKFKVGDAITVDSGLKDVMEVSSKGTSFKGNFSVGSALRVKGGVISMEGPEKNEIAELKARVEKLEKSS